MAQIFVSLFLVGMMLRLCTVCYGELPMIPLIMRANLLTVWHFLQKPETQAHVIHGIKIFYSHTS